MKELQVQQDQGPVSYWGASEKKELGGTLTHFRYSSPGCLGRKEALRDHHDHEMLQLLRAGDHLSIQIWSRAGVAQELTGCSHLCCEREWGQHGKGWRMIGDGQDWIQQNVGNRQGRAAGELETGQQLWDPQAVPLVVWAPAPVGQRWHSHWAGQAWGWTHRWLWQTPTRASPQVA